MLTAIILIRQSILTFCFLGNAEQAEKIEDKLMLSEHALYSVLNVINMWCSACSALSDVK